MDRKPTVQSIYCVQSKKNNLLLSKTKQLVYLTKINIYFLILLLLDTTLMER